MKKLMLIAATAAMTSAFGATEYVYDFSATVKTTKAKFGKTTVKIELGADATGTNFWYTHPSVTNFLDSVHKVKAGVIVPTISLEKLVSDTNAYHAVETLWNNGEGVYKYKSAGVYCATWTITVEDCYRITGSQKLAEVFSTTNCCDTSYQLVSEGGLDTIQYGVADTIGIPLYQWFGSLDPEKATKTEMYAQVLLGNAAAADYFSGWLAGQGTRIKKNGSWVLSTLSGNIVGTMVAPLCETCCTAPVPSVAFDCIDDEAPATAAFGTFRLKLNTAKSQF